MRTVRAGIVVPYRLTNRVVEFEEDRRIAWLGIERALDRPAQLVSAGTP